MGIEVNEVLSLISEYDVKQTKEALRIVGKFVSKIDQTIRQKVAAGQKELKFCVYLDILAEEIAVVKTKKFLNLLQEEYKTWDVTCSHDRRMATITLSENNDLKSSSSSSTTLR
jgi:hypothetical protein